MTHMSAPNFALFYYYIVRLPKILKLRVARFGEAPVDMQQVLSVVYIS
jgi:hypothetical protein